MTAIVTYSSTVQCLCNLLLNLSLIHTCQCISYVLCIHYLAPDLCLVVRLSVCSTLQQDN